MNEITFSVLLEFLYNEFAVTFVFCFLGSCIRSISQTKKQDESKSFNVKRIVISTIFSTLLMCTFTEYIDLQFEVYAFASFFCGLWGLQLCKIAMNIKFIDTKPQVQEASEEQEISNFANGFDIPFDVVE